MKTDSPKLVDNIVEARRRRRLAVMGYNTSQLPSDPDCIARQRAVVKFFIDLSRGGDDLRVDGCAPWNP